MINLWAGYFHIWFGWTPLRSGCPAAATDCSTLARKLLSLAGLNFSCLAMQWGDGSRAKFYWSIYYNIVGLTLFCSAVTMYNYIHANHASRTSRLYKWPCLAFSFAFSNCSFNFVCAFTFPSSPCPPIWVSCSATSAASLAALSSAAEAAREAGIARCYPAAPQTPTQHKCWTKHYPGTRKGLWGHWYHIDISKKVKMVIFWGFVVHGNKPPFTAINLLSRRVHGHSRSIHGHVFFWMVLIMLNKLCTI